MYGVVYRGTDSEREGAQGALLLSIRSSFVEEPPLKCSPAGLSLPAGLPVICPCSEARENQSRLEKVASSGFAALGSWVVIFEGGVFGGQGC